MEKFLVGERVIYQGFKNCDKKDEVSGIVTEILDSNFYLVHFDWCKRNRESSRKVFVANLRKI